MMKPFTKLAVVIFTLVTVVHVLRLLLGWEVTIDGIAIPLWTSVIAGVVTAVLAMMLWIENRQ